MWWSQRLNQQWFLNIFRQLVLCLWSLHIRPSVRLWASVRVFVCIRIERARICMLRKSYSIRDPYLRITVDDDDDGNDDDCYLFFASLFLSRSDQQSLPNDHRSTRTSRRFTIRLSQCTAPIRANTLRLKWNEFKCQRNRETKRDRERWWEYKEKKKGEEINRDAEYLQCEPIQCKLIGTQSVCVCVS